MCMYQAKPSKEKQITAYKAVDYHGSDRYESYYAGTVLDIGIEMDAKVEKYACKRPDMVMKATDILDETSFHAFENKQDAIWVWGASAVIKVVLRGNLRRGVDCSCYPVVSGRYMTILTERNE